jgi:hypothetical protein
MALVAGHGPRPATPIFGDREKPNGDSPVTSETYVGPDLDPAVGGMGLFPFVLDNLAELFLAGFHEVVTTFNREATALGDLFLFGHPAAPSYRDG